VAARARLDAGAAEAASLGKLPLALEAAAALASARRAAGDPAGAGAASRQALSLVERVGSWAGAFRLHLQLADSLRAQGAGGAARAELERAQAEVERVRKALAEEVRAAFDRLPEVERIEREAETAAA
jgi:hypothetical protein